MLITTTTAQLKAAIGEAKRADKDILKVATDLTAYQQEIENLYACISAWAGLLPETASVAVSARQQHATMKVRESILDIRHLHRHFGQYADHHVHHCTVEEISSGSRAVLFPLYAYHPGDMVAISRFYFF